MENYKKNASYIYSRKKNKTTVLLLLKCVPKIRLKKYVSHTHLTVKYI